MISATDNRTTEQLCKLLEERGEDYMRNGFNITWSYYNDPHTATESIDGTLIVTGLTPEQAIAATLGSDASAVRLAERLRSIADEMRHVGASTMTPHELLAFYASEVDKVADSLTFAVTLGSGTCEIVATSTNNLMYPDYMVKWYELSCGHSLTLKGEEELKWCAVCGKAVKQ